MKLYNKETSTAVMPLRELSASDLIAISGGEKTVCTTVSKTTIKGNTTTTTSTTTCTTK